MNLMNLSSILDAFEIDVKKDSSVEKNARTQFHF